MSGPLVADPYNCFSTQPTQAARDALRPQPSCFPSNMASGWNGNFEPTMGTIAGDCTYNSSPPSPMFCPTATPTPAMSLNDYYRETRPQRVALANEAKK